MTLENAGIADTVSYTHLFRWTECHTTNSSQSIALGSFSINSVKQIALRLFGQNVIEREEDMENKEVFRKSNLERISSPEKMNDYIKVINPSVVIMLVALGLLLLGGLAFGLLGNIPLTENLTGAFYADGEDVYKRQIGNCGADSGGHHAGDRKTKRGLHHRRSGMDDHPFLRGTFYRRRRLG